ncbi:MAG: polyphosphate kinase 2 family protein [Phycisphaerales bacterium]|nr:polyphosphate kinase 2 family protein [Phycisphaerales bacterium]
MMTDKTLRGARVLAQKHAVVDGSRFRLDGCDPKECGGRDGLTKSGSQDLLAQGIGILAELQSKLYAQDHWSILLIFQAMDAAGKDGVIKHVMSGINPQGCEVHSFKAPSNEELDHDFMWRSMRRLPPRGTIGIFNRSYYEEVLVVRVHPELLQHQKLPSQLLTDDLFDQRYTDICKNERFLSRNGTVIRKFFLHVSKQEQRKRFLERIDDPEKNWKFSSADVRERQHWDEYMAAYETVIQKTSSPESPWHVIPADNKWYTRLAVAAVIIDTLASLELHYPKLDAKRLAELQAARAGLMAEKS